jgi:hypothetical protein
MPLTIIKDCKEIKRRTDSLQEETDEYDIIEKIYMIVTEVCIFVLYFKLRPKSNRNGSYLCVKLALRCYNNS